MNRYLASAFALTLTLTFLGIHLFAQDISQWASSQKPALYEKVYLQTDRELYSTGDTLWFKSYLVSGLTNKLEPGYKNIYVQLVSPTGKVVANRLLLSIFGEANGDIVLANSIDAGQYTLRSYTKYLENFGEKSYFHRKLWVSKPQTPKEAYLPKQADKTKIDAMFFPAGGNLVLNAANLVAFKVAGEDGKGLEASGKVVDETGNSVLSFKTSWLGLGKFVFMPQEGKTYYATIDNFPNFKYEFRNILADGVSVGCKDMGAEVLATLAGNIKSEEPNSYYLVANHKGIRLFSLKNVYESVKLSKSLFPRGITKLTLLDDDLRIVAERLVFIDLYNAKSVDIKTRKENHSAWEQVDLEISPLLAEGDSMESNLSVAVINEGYVGEDGPSQTIESYLLVDSELKGAIESPASYFYDSDSLTSAEKLDLLMMVQGWRSYYWDEILEKAPKDMAGWDDAGISVEGMVKYMFRDKPVVDGKVVFGPYSRMFLFEQTKTDSLGRFGFKRLYIQDSASLIVNVWTPEGRKNARIQPNPGLQFDSLLAVDPINNTIFNLGTPQKFAEKAFKKLMAEDKFDPDAGSILLGEVNVTAPKFTKDKEFYELAKPFTIPPYRTLKISEQDNETYSYFYEFLDQHSLFMFDGESILYKPYPERSIAFYLDGIKIHPMFIKDIVENLFLEEVNQADIYDSPPGSQGIAYIISVVTKREREEFKPKHWGMAIIQTAGFQLPHAFYSPKYTTENFFGKTPDRRFTLFWSPWAKVENGKAKLDFYTCDNLGNYIAIVEGISKNGKIISGAKRIKVTEFGKK
jgi:hypothetical protein